MESANFLQSCGYVRWASSQYEKQEKGYRDMKHTCEDCQRPIEDAGYCSAQCRTNHRQWLERDRSKSRNIECLACGETNQDRMFCDYRCRDEARTEKGEETKRGRLKLAQMKQKHELQERIESRYRPSGLARAASLAMATALERPGRHKRGRV